MRHIDIQDAGEHGVTFSLKLSDETGEIRARVNACGVDATITQIPPGCGGWQNSHRHERVVEHSHVFRGAVYLVERAEDGSLKCHRYGDTWASGRRFTTRPGKSHNVYVTENTLMVTLKEHDDPENRDWIEDKELDQDTKHLTENDLLLLMGKTCAEEMGSFNR